LSSIALEARVGFWSILPPPITGQQTVLWLAGLEGNMDLFCSSFYKKLIILSRQFLRDDIGSRAIVQHQSARLSLFCGWLRCRGKASGVQVQSLPHYPDSSQRHLYHQLQR
jgi:hypothetical protein